MRNIIGQTLGALGGGMHAFLLFSSSLSFSLLLFLSQVLGSQFEPWVSSLRGVRGNGVSNGEALGSGSVSETQMVGRTGRWGRELGSEAGPEQGLPSLAG